MIATALYVGLVAELIIAIVVKRQAIGCIALLAMLIGLIVDVAGWKSANPSASVNKAEAEEIKGKIEAAGGTVELK